MPIRGSTIRHQASRDVANGPEDVTASLLALLGAIEGQPHGSPAAGAYRAALRRKGEALTVAGGTVMLLDALARVQASSPKRAKAREAILDAAWAGLPGWRS